MIKKILEGITFAEKLLGGTAFAVLTILMALDVFSREAGNGGIDWAQKGAIILMIWGGIIGASLTSAKGGHLRPEIADKLWPESMKPFLKVIEHLLIAAFCVLMFYLSLKNVDSNRGMGDIHPVIDGLPIWTIMMIFPYVFASMALRHFIFAVQPNMRPDDYGELTNALDEFEKEEVGY